MKSLNKCILIACLLAPALTGIGQDTATYNPGYLPIDETIDVKSLQPTVDVNFPRFLLNEVVAGIDEDPDNPFAEAGINLQSLVKEISRIRLIVLEVAEEDRAKVNEATAQLQSILRNNWVSIISVPEENVGLYMIGDETGSKMAGLAILVAQDDTIVVANIEGRVPIGALLMIAAKSDALPDDFLEQLSNLGQKIQTGQKDGNGS